MTDDAGGYGQQDPSDSASEFNQAIFYIRQMLARISTAKLVQVQAVDTEAKTVDVMPMVNQLDGLGHASPLGTVFGIPYIFAQAGSNAVIMDPIPGDKGIMVCADRDISAVLATKDIANPGSYRKMDIADGVYLFGLPGLNDDPEQWVKFTDTGLELHDKNDNNITSDAAGISINGVVFNRQGQIEGALPVTGALQLGGSVKALNGSGYAGDIETAGEVKAGTIGLKAHHHTAQGATAPTTVAQA